MKKLLYLIGIVVVFFVPMYASAQDIVLDGTFEDWEDKPGLEDGKGDEVVFYDIQQVKWFMNPEQEQFYLYIEREPLGDRHNNEEDYNKQWSVNIFFHTDLGERKAVVTYQPSSMQVEVDFYDEQDKRLWKSKGKWGDVRDSRAAFEFAIPSEEIVGSFITGYDFDFYVESSSDRVPDNGVITVSTVSTFPVMAGGAALAFGMVGLVMYLRKRI